MIAAAPAAGAENTLAAPNAIETVVVTAHPIVQDVVSDNFSSTDVVVTDDQLRDTNAVDLPSALREVPGVEITRFNPVGTFGGDMGGGVFIRGIGTSRPGGELMNFVDGIPVYMPIWNHPLFDMLPINGMQTITVYKGPQPQIDGNDFASIDLETKRATDDGIHGDGRLSAGMFDTFIEQSNITGREGDLDFMLAQGFATSNGQRPNADGRLDNVMGRVGWQANPHWSVDADFLYVDGKAHDPLGYSNGAVPEYDTELGLGWIAISHAYDNLHGEVKAYYSAGSGNWLNQPISGTTEAGGNGYYPFNTSGIHWTEDYTPWKGGLVTGGVDFDQVTGHVSTTAPQAVVDFKTPVFQTSAPHIAISQRLDLGGDWSLTPSAGLRYYHSNEFGDATSPHAGLTLASDVVSLFVNVSRGIHYPGLETMSLTEAAGLGGIWGPNVWKELPPERDDHAEIGVKYAPTSSTQININIFQDAIKNHWTISYFPTPFVFNAYRMTGEEFAVRQQLTTNWLVFASLTLLNPSVANLPYSPRQAVSWGINGTVGPIRIAFDGQYQSRTEGWSASDRFAWPPVTEPVNAFTVANARISYPLSALGSEGEVFVAIDNIFNEHYAYYPGYPMPGTWGQIGISASF
ncbi:MAG: TonB-dependent receptor plug domain-containing protein [Rhizomicrobium sp.]